MHGYCSRVLMWKPDSAKPRGHQKKVPLSFQIQKLNDVRIRSEMVQAGLLILSHTTSTIELSVRKVKKVLHTRKAAYVWPGNHKRAEYAPLPILLVLRKMADTSRKPSYAQRLSAARPLLITTHESLARVYNKHLDTPVALMSKSQQADSPSTTVVSNVDVGIASASIHLCQDSRLPHL
ncbi:hypothetical protein FPOAC2_05132 [Fusarium poae]|jgi:hypothetical protein